MSRFGAAAGWAGHVLSWLVILGIGAVITVSVLIPRITGATPYTILTGSMRPTLPPGTMVVVKPVGIDDVRTGDVVTYQLKSGEPTVVTHRVTHVRHSLAGETTLTTQGDANNIPDAEPVRAVQIKGVTWYSVPLLGYLTNLINGKERQIVLYVVVSFLLLYAAYMFTSAARDRRQQKHEVPA